MYMITNLCFMLTISSLVRPLIFSCRFKSRTESVTKSSSEIPHWMRFGEIGREPFPLDMPPPPKSLTFSPTSWCICKWVTSCWFQIYAQRGVGCLAWWWCLSGQRIDMNWSNNLVIWSHWPTLSYSPTIVFCFGNGWLNSLAVYRQLVTYMKTYNLTSYQCDQIWRFIGIWVTF